MKALGGRFAAAFFAFWVLAACGGGSEDGPPTPLLQDFSAPIPDQLTDRLLEEGEFSAEVSLDGANPVSLNRDTDSRQLTALLNALEPGTHTFSIQYFLNGVLVAQGSGEAEAAAGVPLRVSYQAFRFPDSDGDGFSNLAELKILGLRSLAWNDPARRPAAELPRVSKNYAVSDAAGLPFLGGSSRGGPYLVKAGSFGRLE